ncbi:MAG: tetratricopeptide repeat protein, partial [Flavobacteriaceae bacterium]|nr:tetratricopeptide repeat protein [Flavobacteriaceae bacterium]
MKNVFLILLFIFNYNLYAQETTRNDSLAKYSHEELSEKFYAAKPDSLKAVLYAKYAIKKAKKEKDTMQLGSGYYWLSDITKDSTYYVNYWNDIIKTTKDFNNAKYPAFSYLELGDFYFHNGKKNFALNNYLDALKYVNKIPNDSLKAFLFLRIGASKDRNLEYDEALKLYKNSLNYFNKENYTRKELNEYFALLINLAKSYTNKKQYDSAVYYNKKAYLIALKFNRNELIGYFTFFSGGILLKKKNYTQAIDSIKKSIPYIINDENYAILSSCFFYIGQSYYNLNDIKNALKYFNKVDSLFNKTKNCYNHQKLTYKYLIDHYKNEGNNTKQLMYINKYIKVDSVLNTRSKNIAKNLTEN